MIWNLTIGQEYKNIKVNEKREYQRIAEYQYTCLESIICLMKIVNEGKGFYQLKPTLENYLVIINSFFLFEAHLGRIFETLKRIRGVLKINSDSQMKEFYHHRHNVIHSHKLPFKFEGKTILIPKLKAQR